MDFPTYSNMSIYNYLIDKSGYDDDDLGLGDIEDTPQFVFSNFSSYFPYPSNQNNSSVGSSNTMGSSNSNSLSSTKFSSLANAPVGGNRTILGDITNTYSTNNGKSK